MSAVDLRLASTAQLRRLIEQSVLHSAPDEHTEPTMPGVAPEQQAEILRQFPAPRTLAAVLMPLVLRDDGISVLFTQRATHMRKHAGQISFPGGRIEPEDQGPLAAALRETQEEIGLSADYIEAVGYLSPSPILTGYTVIPVVGFVRPGFSLQLDASEVAEVFEVPFAYFLDPDNHQSRSRLLGTVTVQAYDIPYGERRIWGATAGMIMNLYQRLVQQAAA